MEKKGYPVFTQARPFVCSHNIASLSTNVIVNNDLCDRLNVETKFMLTAGPQMWPLFIIHFETLPLYFFLFLCCVCMCVWCTHMHTVM